MMKPVKLKRTQAQKGRKKGKRKIRLATISATQAARTFSDLLNRIHYRGETFVIERGGEPICEISPVKPPRFTGADLLTLLRSLPKPDTGYWDAVEEAMQEEPTIPESPWER